MKMDIEKLPKSWTVLMHCFVYWASKEKEAQGVEFTMWGKENQSYFQANVLIQDPGENTECWQWVLVSSP